MELDSLMDVMGNSGRRSVVYVLNDMEADEIRTEDIERELWDRGYLDFEDAEEFELALHHNYLPKLEDYGVLTHEPETGKVSYNPDDVFEQQVEEIRQLEDDYGGQSFISQSF